MVSNVVSTDDSSQLAYYTSTNTVVKGDSNKRFHSRVVYNKGVNKKVIKGLLVRPLDQAIAVFRETNAKVARSYADVVKNGVCCVQKISENEPIVISGTGHSGNSNSKKMKQVITAQSQSTTRDAQDKVVKELQNSKTLLYDVNEHKGDKFINSILFGNQKIKIPDKGQECLGYLKCKEQSDFDDSIV